MMKRKIGIALLCLMLAALPMLVALAEAAPGRTVYADQGGVRVFSENGLAGLMDAEGNVVLPAEYDGIEPFGDSDFARARCDDRFGVVGRDGAVAVPCKWQVVDLYPGVGLAECWNDFGDQHIYDLAAGEEWKALGPNVAFDADEHYIYLLTYGEAGFGYEPPYHTDVYDAARNPLFSADAWFARGFGPDYAILEYDDGSYGVMDTSGRTVMDGLSEAPMMDGHGWVYDTPRSGNIHYVRTVKNALSRWLKPVKLDRRHMVYYLQLMGVDPDGDAGEAALRFYEDGHVCGVADPEGNTLFELPGVGVYGPDDAGLYRVQTHGCSGLLLPSDRWGYVDAAGEFVLEPKYSQAYAFVDGAAVVVEDGKWRLIDTEGATLAEWDQEQDAWGMDGLQLPVIGVKAEDGCRVIDRRGDPVTDEVFRNAGDVFGDQLLLTDRSGNLCLMDGGGQITLRVPCESWTYYGDDGGKLWLLRDGLWGLMSAAGERAGEWLVPPEYEGMDWLDDGLFCLNRPDGTAIYADESGAALGPAPVAADDGW